jgi:hypothetical protein
MPKRQLFCDTASLVYCTPDELSELFGFCTRTWRRWALEGRIPGALRFGRKLMIPLKAVQELLASEGVRLEPKPESEPEPVPEPVSPELSDFALLR